jgi:hypothetical protein
MNFRRPTRRGVAARALTPLLAAVLVACGPDAATPSGSVPSPSASQPGSTATPGGANPTPAVSLPPSAACPPPALVPALPAQPTEGYDAIEQQVVRIRGLQPTSDVEPQVLDAEGIRELTTDSFRRDNPEELVAANELMLKGLGLLDANDSLEALYLDLLASQVAGLYDPDTKSMYVVSRTGALGPSEKTTFAHEYTHALQDQNFELSTFELAEIGEGDRGVARLSLIEGDATLLMTLWQLESLTQAELIALLGEAMDPEATRILNEMPPVLIQSLLFPYTAGMNFVQCLYADGSWASIDAAYDDPPASTEQILHPEKYTAREAPIAVDLPDDLAERLGEGWSVGLEDTLGEFQLRLWMEHAGGGGGGPVDAAGSGWGGDRSVVLDGPGDEFAIVLSTEWDTAADAAEFIERADMALTGVPFPGTADGPVDGTTATVVIASTDDLVGRVQNVLGLAG